MESKLILAPMAGITDYPLRMLCRSFGAELAFIEMLNCRSLSHKSKRTQAMLFSNPLDKPLGVQILGSEDRYIKRALEVLSRYKFDLLDFNAACPAKKVVRRGEGAGLLKDPKKLGRLIRLIVENSRHPVSIKIRIGWDSNSVNAQDIAKIAQDNGTSCVFIHGRTKEQAYSGQVDYGTIAKVKRALKIPLVASGNIFTAQLAKKMLDETGCDGLAIARGALGNPWIFQEVKNYLASGLILARPDKQEIVRVMRRHLRDNISYFGEAVGVMLFRKFFAWYTRGFSNVRQLRQMSSTAKSAARMEEIIGKA